jgi:hypothetical protein
MRRIAYLAGAMTLVVAGSIAHTLGDFHPMNLSGPDPVLDGMTVDTAMGEIAGSVSLAPILRSAQQVRRHISERAGGTYINEVLATRDSNIARWANRRAHPVRVWIQSEAALDGFDPSVPLSVRNAFADWSAASIPVAFSFVRDSARAEVRVSFVDRFDDTMSGRTRWVRDGNWWIVGADIELALHSGTGRRLTPDQTHAIALHEVGHLLGLDHTADTTSIMASRVRALSLTPRDVSTLRLIYEVPAGSVR